MSLWSLVQVVLGDKDEIVLDTKILRLHSRLSFRIFFISSLLVTLESVVVDKYIRCYDHDKVDDTLDAFCWIQTTYSVKELFHNCGGKKSIY